MPLSCILPAETESLSSVVLKKQHTLKNSISLSGAGLFTGKSVTLKLLPAPAGTGIVFKRMDLPFEPRIPAHLDYVQAVSRCSQLKCKEASVQTVEHLLAALSAYEIDNILIEMDGPEVPIMDGSSAPFTDLLEKAGKCKQEENQRVFKISSPLSWSQGDVHIIALPSEEYRISYTLHYPHSSFLRSQYYSIPINPKCFKTEIAPCRTFSLYEEIAPLLDKGYLKGGSLENGVIIKDNAILNPEGIRFPDEMVRHKILDMIGDLSLIGVPFLAHVIAIRSGHASNHAFAKELLTQIKMESS